MKSSSKKGTEFENRVYKAISVLLRDDRFLFSSQYCEVFQQKGYYSKDREKPIKVDVAIEVRLPDTKEWSILCIIECKDYTKNVPIDDIEELKAKLDQIAGKNVKGILCATSSFHETVMTYARNNGIGLCRMLPDDQIEWSIYREVFSPVTWDKLDIIKDEVSAALIELPYKGKSNFIFTFINNRFYSNFAVALSDFLEFHKEPQITNGEIFAFLHDDDSTILQIPYLPEDEIENLTESILSEIDETLLTVPQGMPIIELEKYINDKYKFTINYPEVIEAGVNGEEILGKINFDKKTIKISNRLNYLDPRWMFTIAHEIGHVVLHGGLFLNDDSNEHSDSDGSMFSMYVINPLKRKMEIQANMFAASILMPRSTFTKYAYWLALKYDLHDRGHGLIYVDNQECNKENYYNITSELMTVFKVSRKAVASRLKKLGFLKYGEISKWAL